MNRRLAHDVTRATPRIARPIGVVILCSGLVACCPGGDPVRAVEAINTDFQPDYERIIARDGTRHFDLSPERAFDVVRATLGAIGFSVTAADPVAGYLRGEAPAPTPLSAQEWSDLAKTDHPRFRKHVVEECGFVGNFYDFQPDLVDLVVDVLVIPAGSRGVDVSMAIQMRFKDASAGLPPRSYPPPTPLEAGIGKFWKGFERQLGAG